MEPQQHEHEHEQEHEHEHKHEHEHEHKHELPKFVLMKQRGDKSGFYNDGGPKAKIPNAVTIDSEKGVFNPLAKIEVESSRTDTSCVHLKFPLTKKYLSVHRFPGFTKAGVVVARSDNPEEDTTNPSCTLFRPVAVSSSYNGEISYYQLIHVESGLYVSADADLGLSVNNINSKFLSENTFVFVDLDTIVKLPECVAFKGNNDKYLQAHWQDDLPYLQFSSDDPYHVASVFRVETRLDGSVRIKSEYYQKYWKLCSTWIRAEEEREGSFDRLDDVFWPNKINESTVALRPAPINRYCARVPYLDRKKDFLNAAVTTMDMTARLGVEELVSERNITSVVYRMDEARIIGEKPHVAGQVNIENNGDHDAAMAVDLGFEDEESFSFSHGYSVMGGVKATITTSVPFIVKGEIEVTTAITVSLQWGSTTTEKKLLKATGTVTVPARHTVLVYCVGTRGTCNIPFSYTQIDRSSVHGTVTRKRYDDGVFTGSNSYNFHFIMDKAIPIV